MKKKQLVRTLGLAQIMMLGIGGTMGAGVFVLTGHAAGLVGPAVILVFLLAGLQSLPNSMPTSARRRGDCCPSAWAG